jgi:hypothetical protein
MLESVQGDMARKPKKTQNMGFKTTIENEQFVIARAHINGTSASEYIHRLITADRQKIESDLKVMAKALGLNINPVNKDNG